MRARTNSSCPAGFQGQDQVEETRTKRVYTSEVQRDTVRQILLRFCRMTSAPVTLFCHDDWRAVVQDLPRQADAMYGSRNPPSNKESIVEQVSVHVLIRAPCNILTVYSRAGLHSQLAQMVLCILLILLAVA